MADEAAPQQTEQPDLPMDGNATEQFTSPEINPHGADSEQALPTLSQALAQQKTAPPQEQPKAPPTLRQALDQFNGPETTMQALGHDFMDRPQHYLSPSDWIADAILPAPGQSMTESQKILAERHPMGHIVDAFTGAFSQTFEEQAKLSPEMEESLKKAGTYHEYMDKQKAIDDGFLQGIALPLAKDLASGLGVDVTTFLTAPVVHGAADAMAAMSAGLEGVQAVIGETGRQTGQEQIAHAAQAGLEFQAMGGLEGIPRPPLPPHIAEAKSAGILDAEAQRGVATPAQEQAMRRAAAMYPQRYDEYYAETPARAKPVVDIHEAAALKDPEAFRQRDALDARRDTLMQWHTDEAARLEAETEKRSPFLDELNKQRDKRENGSPKNRKVYQARVDDLEAKHNSWMLDQVRDGTPFMKDIERQLDENDRQRVALAHTGRISAAYRDSQNEMPAESPKPAADVPSTATTEKPAAPAPEVKATEKPSYTAPEKPLVTDDAKALLKSVDAGGIPFAWTKNLRRIAKENGFKETVDTRPSDLIDHLRSKMEPAKPEPVQEHAPAPEPELPVKPGEMSIEAQKDEIAAEVQKQLVAAGRPEEEAALAARLEAERYATRAKRFEGKRGTALEMWRALGSKIKEGQLKAVRAAKAKSVKAPKLYASPILQEISRMGGVREGSKIAQELHSIGLKNGEKGVPFNFFKTQKEGGPKVGAGDLDNWVAREFNDKFDTTADEDGNGNVDRDWLIERIKDEFQMAGKQLGEQYEKESSQRASDNQADIFNSLKEDVTATANKMGVEGLTDKEIESIVSKLKDDITLDTEDAISDHIEREAITEFGQSARGKIRMGAEKVRSIITILGKGDASTFIHEIGHDWLDQLLKDAEHPDAPQSLKDDAEIVKKWTGIESWRRPKDKKSPEYKAFVRGHEKWARSVERRLMEGTAPSRALDTVFAKFKGWLTQIYKTFDALHAPITDDIRGVMDRLMTDRPSSAVIARDREPGEIMAGMHERDAEELPPDTPATHADNVGDHIAQEVDLTAKRFNDEVRDALDDAKQTGSEPSPTDSHSEISEQARESAGATGPAQEPATVTGGGGQGAGTGGQEPVAEPARGPGPGTTVGSGDGAEPGGTAAGDRSGGADGQERGTHAQPDELTPGEPTHWDKAGNIRLDLLNTPEDINNALRELAADNDDFQGARRGQWSQYDMQQLAESMGVKESEINLQKLRQMSIEDGIPLAVRIRGGRIMLSQVARSAIDIAKKVGQSNTIEDITKFVQIREQFLRVAETVAAITAEWGRAGNAFKVLSQAEAADLQAVTELFQGSLGKTPEEVMRQAKALAMMDTPGRAARVMRDQTKPSLGTQWVSMVVNGLISNPITHTTYSLANRLLMTWKATAETTAAYAAGRVAVHLLGRPESHIGLNEIVPQLKAGITSLPEQISAAGKAAKTGVATLLPQHDASWRLPFQYGDAQSIEPPRISNDFTTWRQLGADLKGALRGAVDSFITGARQIKVGDAPWFEKEYSAIGPIPNLKVKGVPVPLGTTIELPGRGVAVVHSFDKVAAYAMDRAALIHRQASKEGLTGDAYDRRVDELFQNTPDDITKAASESAPQTVLMQGGTPGDFNGSFINKLSAMVGHKFDLPGLGQTPLLKFIDPFVHISSNVIREYLGKRTPIGVLSADIRRDLSGANGPAARDMAWGRMGIIAPLFGLAVGHMVASGRATGSGPSDPRENKAWQMMTGEMPHSIRIGETWYDVHRLGVMGGLFNTAADLFYVAGALEHGDGLLATSLFMHSVAQNLKDESFLKGVSDMMQALDDSDRYGETWLKNMAVMNIPFSSAVYQAARMGDPYQRYSRTIIDGIKEHLPGLREELFPKRDIWGELLPAREQMGDVLSIYESKMNNDPTNQALMRVGIFPGQPARKVAGVTLSESQYDQFCAMSGHLAKMRLDATVNATTFQQLPEFIQRKEISQIIEKSRKQAAASVMMRPENANIINDAKALKTGINRPVVNGVEVR